MQVSREIILEPCNHVSFVFVSEDPRSGDGLSHGIGSVGMGPDGSLYRKTGAGNNDWTVIVDVSAGGVSGAALTESALPAPAMQTLADAATVTWAVAGKRDPRAKVTISGNRTLAFTGLAAGQSGVLLVTQGLGGSHALTLPAGSIVRDTGAGAITLSTAAGAKDLLSFVSDGTNIWWSYGVSYT